MGFIDPLFLGDGEKGVTLLVGEKGVTISSRKPSFRKDHDGNLFLS